MLTATPPQDPPPQTIHDVEHAPPEVTRAVNESLVLAALDTPGTASELAKHTGLSFIAVAAALHGLIARGQAFRDDALRFHRKAA